jgi:beta-lactamase class C
VTSPEPASAGTGARESQTMELDPRAARLRALAHRMTDKPELPFCVPGLAAVITRAGDVGDAAYVGVDGAGTPIREDTIFPLASASKLAMGLAVLHLVDRAQLSLDDPLARYVPEALAAREGVTVRALLSHTSGLPLDLDPAVTDLDPSLDWTGVARGCLRTPLAAEPGASVQYSNVAYGLLAIVLERVSGADFKQVLEERVFSPLGVEAYIGRIPPRRPAVIVDIDSAHVGTGMEPYNSEFWYRLGTPWAGIHSTAAGLLALLRAYVEPSPAVVGAATLAEARRDQTGGLPGGFATTDPFLGFRGSRAIAWPRCAWGLGVELRGDKRPHWTPAVASPESFGQIGASGCIAWCDPVRGVAWAVLAPRTTDNGWLLRHGPALGSAALQAPAEAAQP